MQGIRILVVDDSRFFRETLARGVMANLPSGSSIEKASNPFEARDKILTFDPDVMLLDVEMPRMNGIEFLRRLLSQYDLPTIVMSSRPDYRASALDAGAYDFLSKPVSTEIESFLKDLAIKIKGVYEKHQMIITKHNSSKAVVEESNKELSPLQSMLRSAKKDGFNVKSKPVSSLNDVVTNMKQLSENARLAEAASGRKKVSAKVPSVAPKPKKPVELIAIGASTGGTEALAEVLRALRPPLPPIVIVQHIPPMFSRLFAERLNTECRVSVKEAENGDKLERNCVYVAAGDKHMSVRRMGSIMNVDCFVGEKVNGHMPSVDVLFNSVAEKVGAAALGVILTGMGEDGARGMLKMRQAGSITLGQDEASCVVYGMPKAAFEMGAVTQQLPLNAVAGMITSIAGYQGR